MDLQISVVLLFVLFTAGHSFSCYDCFSKTGNCLNQTIENCFSGNSNCSSTTSMSDFGGISESVKIKRCASVCVNQSVNYGITRASSVCCDTDLCNLYDAPDPNSLPPNGKKCYSCDEKSCSNTVSCTGTEDHCITVTGYINDQFMLLKGCASKSFCYSPPLVRDAEETICCSGNLCNGAESVSQSFLFLCCSLLSFILLH